MGLRVYKYNDASQPPFPSTCEIVRRATLQKTELGANHNKYYNIELHKAGSQYRIFTHYGRTDDLASRPDSGVREHRYPAYESEALSEYQNILHEKTGPKKGYVEVALASTKVGSAMARGQASGHMDAATLQRLQKKDEPVAKPEVKVSTLDALIRDLVAYLYKEATGALTSNKVGEVSAKITAQGVETPLGVLTISQIEKGEAALKTIYELITIGAKSHHGDLFHASSAFYSLVPHNLGGRARATIQAQVIDSVEKVAAKQETLQLMRDMLVVSGDNVQVLVSDDIDEKYHAMGVELEAVPANVFVELSSFVRQSLYKNKNIQVKGAYRVRRPQEHAAFEEGLGNVRKLFHGSRPKNWLGILSRGILLPKIVQTMGVNRTDAGWLGNGIYFGSEACTASYYTFNNGSRGTRFMSVAEVALGKICEFTKITYGLEKPPTGYDSCYGVPRRLRPGSGFDDNEFVVYRTTQQRQMYLIEFTM